MYQRYRKFLVKVRKSTFILIIKKLILCHRLKELLIFKWKSLKTRQFSWTFPSLSQTLSLYYFILLFISFAQWPHLGFSAKCSIYIVKNGEIYVFIIIIVIVIIVSGSNKNKVLTFITIIASFGDTFSLFVLNPGWFAGETGITATSGTSLRALHALFTFLVTVEAVWTVIQTFAFIRKFVGATLDALGFRWTVAWCTRRMAVCTTN